MEYSKLRSAIIATSIITLGSALTACGSSSSDGPSSVVVESFLKSDTHQEDHVALTKIVVNGNAEFIADDGQKIVQVHGSAGKDEIDLTIEISLKNLDISSVFNANRIVTYLYLVPESVTKFEEVRDNSGKSYLGSLVPTDFIESNGQQTITMPCKYDNGQENSITCLSADRQNTLIRKILIDDNFGLPNYKVSDKLNLFIYSVDPDSPAYTYTSIPIQFN